MFEFLKNLFKKVNFKTDNEEVNKYNKIIYSIIIICAIFFIGFIIYCVVTQLPVFIETFKEAWNDSDSVLNGYNK